MSFNSGYLYYSVYYMFVYIILGYYNNAFALIH